jgi:hypothetical protein
MGPKKSGTISVGCPCCGARLNIDAEFEKVLSYDPPPENRSTLNLDNAAALLKEQAARREAIFDQSSEDIKNQAQLLERKFKAALEKSKHEPVEKPTRDIDLE